jgi:hypothetical protein
LQFYHTYILVTYILIHFTKKNGGFLRNSEMDKCEKRTGSPNKNS